MTGQDRSSHDDSASRLLSFWFEELTTKDWFMQSDAVDQALAARFGHLLAPAEAGELDHWLEDPDTALALILVLDQLPRNLRRGSPAAFDLDPKGLATARALIERHEAAFRAMTPQQKLFVLLPFEHAEDLTAQDESVGWFGHFTPSMTGEDAVFWADVTDYAHRHREPIRHFGRFPHRNTVLGRDTTPDEAAWLDAHPGGF